MDEIFLPGDKVFYCGQKHRVELVSKDGKPMAGWIHATVEGQPHTFVVEFPECKNPDFVMSAHVLTKWRPSKQERQAGPEIRPRRQKGSSNEEET